MGLRRSILKKMAGALGYDLVRKGKAVVRPENFANLAKAYEAALNREAGVHIPEGSARRPILLSRVLGTPPAEAYVIIAKIAETADLPGDVCEFGVAHGETSAVIADEIAEGEKVLHLFDSFEGLPAPTDKDQLKDDVLSLGSMAAYEGKMAAAADFVIARMETIGFPSSRYRLHKGFFEETVKTRAGFPEAVSFAYVDFDFYEPILTALRYLDEVLSPGGVVMVDDYDFFSTGAKTAVDEFVDEANAERERYAFEASDGPLGCFALLHRRERVRGV